MANQDGSNLDKQVWSFSNTLGACLFSLKQGQHHLFSSDQTFSFYSNDFKPRDLFTTL